MRQILLEVHSVAREIGRAAARCSWGELHLCLGPGITTGPQWVQNALIDATASAKSDTEGEFVLDIGASAVAISRILHEWQGPPRNVAFDPLGMAATNDCNYGKYDAPKLEMYAACHFNVQTHRYLCSRKFTLRVDTQALSWLKTYSTDQARWIGRWIMELEKYLFRVEHRPRTQHRNAIGLFKRTKEYQMQKSSLRSCHRWQKSRFFLSQAEYDQLPIVSMV